jgi:hypothetical protein
LFVVSILTEKMRLSFNEPFPMLLIGISIAVME